MINNASFLVRLSSLVSQHFLLFWLLILVSILALILFSSRRFVVAEAVEAGEGTALAVARGWYPTVPACLAFLLFLCCYIFLMFYKEDFAYHDSGILLNSTLLAKNASRPIDVASGRFFPLAHQEWNVIRHLTQSPGGYHVLPAVQLVVVVVVLFQFMSAFAVSVRLAIILMLLVSPSFVISFFDLVVPERNVLFWLALFLLAEKHFAEFGGRLYFTVVMVAVHCCLYYKEPVFLLLGGFSVMRLALCAWFDGMWKRVRDFSGNNILDSVIIGLCLTFVGFYAVINIPYRSLSYAGERSAGFLPTTISYFRSDLLLDLLLVVFVVRIAYLVYAQVTPDRFWEPLAAGALLYFLCLITLKLWGIYYTAPIDLIAALYVAHALYPFSGRITAKATIAVLALAIVGWHLALSLEWIAFSKNMIEGRMQVAEFLREYAKSRTGLSDVIVFGNVQQFALSDVFSFFAYKGLRFDDSFAVPPPGQHIFLVKSLAEFRQAFHARNNVFKCAYTKAPLPGELVIILPDEEMRASGFAQLLQEGTILFHYRPLFSNHHWLREGVIPGEPTRRMDAYVIKIAEVRQTPTKSRSQYERTSHFLMTSRWLLSPLTAPNPSISVPSSGLD